MLAVDRALHMWDLQIAQLTKERIVGVFHEKIDVVLEAVKVDPSLGFVDVPKAVGSAAQYDRQIRVIRLRNREREIARVQQPNGSGTREEFADSLLLGRVAGNDGPKKPAALGQ